MTFPRLLRIMAFCLACCLSAGVSQAEQLLAQSRQPVTAAQAQEAASFWRTFRQALLQGQRKPLEAMTRLPLVVKGVTDDQAPRRVGKSQLTSTLAALLNQQVYPAHGEDDRPQSLRQLLEATPTLLPQHWTTPQQLRVESLAFSKGKTGWKLVTVYEEAP